MRAIVCPLQPMRAVLVAAVSLFAAFAVADHVTLSTAKEDPAPAAASCLPELVGTQLWLSLRPDLQPSPGSPAAFRLADQRNYAIWANTRPDLKPAAGSPAAFRLKEQRDKVAAVVACLH
jgi:hypothetical protein